MNVSVTALCFSSGPKRYFLVPGGNNTNKGEVVCLSVTWPEQIRWHSKSRKLWRNSVLCGIKQTFLWTNSKVYRLKRKWKISGCSARSLDANNVFGSAITPTPGQKRPVCCRISVAFCTSCHKNHTFFYIPLVTKCFALQKKNRLHWAKSPDIHDLFGLAVHLLVSPQIAAVQGAQLRTFPPSVPNCLKLCHICSDRKKL